MKKDELIAELAALTELPKVKVKAVLDALPAVVAKELKEKGKSEVHGLAVYKVADRAERTCRNPTTGAPVKVPARKVVTATITHIRSLYSN